MKLLALTILISFSALADVKVSITSLKGSSFRGEFETVKEADDWIEENKENDSWGKKQRWELFEDQTTCLETKEVLHEVDDISIPYPDPIPEGYIHPQVEIVSHQMCKMPVEYAILKEDITDEMNAKREKKIKAKNDLIDLDAKLLDGSAKLSDIIDLLKLIRNLE